MVEMPAVVGEKIFPISLMGGAARRALGAGGPGDVRRTGKVLAVFRRSFYLEMPGPKGSRPAGSKLVCIGPVELGAGPLNILCDLPGEMVDWEKAGLRPGAAAEVCGDSLVIEKGSLSGGFVFSLADAQTWRPNISLGPPNPENISRALGALAGEAERRAPAQGMGRLLPGIARGDLGPASGPGAAKAAGDPFLPMAAEGAKALLGWMKSFEAGAVLPAPPVPPVPPVEAEILIGLGPGLTPSGDDFIGGAMVALRSLGAGALADRLAAWALPLAEKRTGRISWAHLECAAAGEGAGALHEAIRAMCSYEEFSGGDILAKDILGCVDALDAIGHTSGWDALTGVVAGAAAAGAEVGREAFAVDESKTGAAP
jgi:hypothetical protein